MADTQTEFKIDTGADVTVILVSMYSTKHFGGLEKRGKILLGRGQTRLLEKRKFSTTLCKLWHKDNDKILIQLKKFCTEGWPDKFSIEWAFQPSLEFAGELTIRVGHRASTETGSEVPMLPESFKCLRFDSWGRSKRRAVCK